MSTTNTPSLSCKQIMLRGLDDVCVRNKIVWYQFWRSRCAALRPEPADTHGRETVLPLERSWLWQWCLPDVWCICDVFFVFPSVFMHFASLMKRTEPAPFVWIMSFDRLDLFSVRINQSLKISTWHFQEVINEETVTICFLKHSTWCH